MGLHHCFEHVGAPRLLVPLQRCSGPSVWYSAHFVVHASNPYLLKDAGYGGNHLLGLPDDPPSNLGAGPFNTFGCRV